MRKRSSIRDIGTVTGGMSCKESDLSTHPENADAMKDGAMHDDVIITADTAKTIVRAGADVPVTAPIVSVAVRSPRSCAVRIFTFTP